MCYDDQARPPEPPGSVGVAHGEDIVLTAQDGTQFAAYAARPEQSSSTYVLIYPDVRGLHQFYKELALRFAEIGIPAIAIDYFGRTAGLTARDESFDFWPHVEQVKFDSFVQDVQAALGFIRDASGEGAQVFVVGFCMGGTLTLLSGTRRELGLTGLIPFYSGLSRDVDGQGTALDRASKTAYPVLAHFGGDDQGIPQDQVQALDEQLDAAGVEHEVVVYPGAPHSFFDRRAEQFATESAQAWQRSLEFIKAHTTQNS
ncbi:MAG: dienelactone hydrolase family protein [Chloroflexi bacterium]|nr:dienelactone hydrolase family protein [Chloroflexota bacterium]